MTHRTRIKICGLTRAEDLTAAVAAGADAIGFVFYPASPRHVTPAAAARLAALLPPFVSVAGLFVNASQQQIAATADEVPLSLLQFHGDETPEACAAAARAVRLPYIRALRVKASMTGKDLLQYESDCQAASLAHGSSAAPFRGVLLDTFVESYGGAGKVFDWSLIPKELAHRAALSGGLSAQNATEAVRRVRPFAVDVSSGVELAKGVKDADRMRAFVEAVRLADSC